MNTELDVSEIFSNYAFEGYVKVGSLIPKFIQEQTDEIADLVKKAVAGKDSRILDCACGTGVLLHQLALDDKINAELYGWDISQGMIKVAKETTHPSIKYSVRNAEQPETNMSFDVVVCKNALYYMEPERAFYSFSQLIAPEGHLIFTSLNRNADNIKLKLRLMRIGIYDSSVRPFFDALLGKIPLSDAIGSLRMAKANIQYQKLARATANQAIPLPRLHELLSANSFEVSEVREDHYVGTQYLIDAVKL